MSRFQALISCTLLFLCVASAQEPGAHVLQYIEENIAVPGNSIRTARVYEAGLLFIQWKLAPCSGLQVHYHTMSELFQPVSGNLTVGVVDSYTKQAAVFNLTAGQLLHIPAGHMHFVSNFYTCNEAVAVGTWSLDSNTTWVADTFAAIPAELQTNFVQAPMPMIKGTYPYVNDTACLARCGVAPPVAAAAGAAGTSG